MIYDLNYLIFHYPITLYMVLVWHFLLFLKSPIAPSCAARLQTLP